jgi:hypothetical protein
MVDKSSPRPRPRRVSPIMVRKSWLTAVTELGPAQISRVLLRPTRNQRIQFRFHLLRPARNQPVLIAEQLIQGKWFATRQGPALTLLSWALLRFLQSCWDLNGISVFGSASTCWDLHGISLYSLLSNSYNPENEQNTQITNKPKANKNLKKRCSSRGTFSCDMRCLSQNKLFIVLACAFSFFWTFFL